MIRLTSAGEYGTPFKKAEGLMCTGYSDEAFSQDFALRLASFEMKPEFVSLGDLLGVGSSGDVGAYVVKGDGESKYGAICLFYNGVLDVVHDYIGDFYALPASIHEWIIVKRDTELLDGFRKIVREVNSLIDPCDKLSDDVYEYIDGVFRIAR